MYALINTFNCPSDSIGKVISMHETKERAEQALFVLQSKARGGYSPTRVVRVRRLPRSYVCRKDVYEYSCDHNLEMDY